MKEIESVSKTLSEFRDRVNAFNASKMHCPVCGSVIVQPVSIHQTDRSSFSVTIADKLGKIKVEGSCGSCSFRMSLSMSVEDFLALVEKDGIIK